MTCYNSFTFEFQNSLKIEKKIMKSIWPLVDPKIVSDQFLKSSWYISIIQKTKNELIFFSNFWVCRAQQELFNNPTKKCFSTSIAWSWMRMSFFLTISLLITMMMTWMMIVSVLEPWSQLSRGGLDLKIATFGVFSVRHGPFRKISLCFRRKFLYNISTFGRGGVWEMLQCFLNFRNVMASLSKFYTAKD